MKEIQIQINENLEFINSILLTSHFNSLTKPLVGFPLMTDAENEYTSAIRSFFREFQDHKVYRVIEGMIPKGFLFSRPVEIALSLGKRDFAVRLPLSPLCIDYSGGMTKIGELLEEMKDLSEASLYFDFFESQKSFYRDFLKKAEETLSFRPAEVLEEEFGREQNSYHYVISSLMNGNFGISFREPQAEKADLFSVFTADSFSLSPAVLFHEFSHPFINPLTKKNAALVHQYREAYGKLAPYRLPDYRSGYGDWEECVNEHLVRAMAVHLLKKCRFNELSEELFRMDFESGYRYLPLILEKYEYYDRSRGVYADFEAYLPELLKVFSENIG